MKTFIIILTCVLLACGVVVMFGTSAGTVGSSTSGKDIVSNVVEDVEVDFSDKSIGFIGDSITYGIDGSAGQSRMEKPLPTLVAETLGCVSSFNYGISGSILSTYLLNNTPIVNRFGAMDSSLDIICLWGGVNDFAVGAPLGTLDSLDKGTVYGALNIIVAGLKERYPNAFIFMMTPLGMSQERIDRSTADYSLLDINSAIKRIGIKYNIPVLDLYNEVNYRTTEMLDANNDGIHPSQEYTRRYIAPTVSQFIRDNYNK